MFDEKKIRVDQKYSGHMNLRVSKNIWQNNILEPFLNRIDVDTKEKNSLTFKNIYIIYYIFKGNP